MKTAADWVPTVRDHDWIESASAPVAAAFQAIEVAARPTHVPILDRSSGRVLASLAADRRRIVEVGTAYGYSTLWMALAQPPDGTIVTIDPDQERTDLARGWWRDAGVAADNVLWSGRVSGERPSDPDDRDVAALRRFDEAMLRDPRFVTSVLPVGDGLLVAGRRQ